MARREGFGSGFLLGSLVGGAIGGLVGAALVARKDDRNGEDGLFQAPVALDADNNEDGLPSPGARRSLEEKISQINLAIEDVRQRLNSEGGASVEHNSQQ